MTQKILEAEGEGYPVQLDFFLKGNLALEKNARRKPHSWLPDQVICRVLLLPDPAALAASCSAHGCCHHVLSTFTPVLPIFVRLRAWYRLDDLPFSSMGARYGRSGLEGNPGKCQLAVL